MKTESNIMAMQSAERFAELFLESGMDLPVEPHMEELKKPLEIEEEAIPNRICIQPLEGYDSCSDGSPSDLVYRRYRRFAESAHKVDGEGLTDFEREVFRAVVAHSFTAEEHEAYSDRWADDEEPIMDFQGEDFLS